METRIAKDKENLKEDVDEICECKQNLLFVIGRLNYFGLKTEIELWKGVVETLDEVIVHHLQKEERRSLIDDILGRKMVVPMDPAMFNFKKSNTSPGETPVERAIDEIEQVQETIVTLYEYYVDGDTFIIDFPEIMMNIKKVKKTLESI